MINLKNRIIDEYGKVCCDTDIFLEALYNDDNLSNYYFEKNPSIVQYKQNLKKYLLNDDVNFYEKNDMNVSEYHKNLQNQWFIPEEYLNINLEEYFFNKIKTNEEKKRVIEELELYKSKSLEPVLCFIIYLVDIFKKNNIIYGIGRGSSCASYLLYLIGLHKVNSILYELDVKEFLR